MKKVRKFQKKLTFLSALLFIFSAFTPISFSENYTMRIIQRMDELPANKSFSVRFNDVPDLNNILQKKGILIVDLLQDVPQDITLSLDPSNPKILRIDPPHNGYAPGKEYLLFIHNNWTSTSGKKLRRGIQMPFHISETPPPAPSPNPSPFPTPSPSPTPTPQPPAPESDFIFDKTTGTITGYKGKIEHLVIPEKIDGVAVQYIGERAFWLSSGLISVTIPDSVVTIKDDAFYGCGDLRSLTLGNRINSIESFAFCACEINTLTLPASLRNIGGFAFANNKIHTLNFAPNGELETIGTFAFSDNELSSLNVPSSVRTIKENAFRFNSISDLVFENGVQQIGSSSFSNNKITSLVIPDSVQTIDAFAFADNPLDTAELPQHTNISSIFSAFPDKTKVIRRP